MTQNRPPPAYQEYAAAMLSTNDFRMMSLASRGLWYTIRLEYWVGNPIPSDSVVLGKILGFTADDVATALSELLNLVKIKDGYITIPELDDYKHHLAERRQKQSNGGKEGAEIARRNAAKRKTHSQNVCYPEVDREITHGYDEGTLVQASSMQSNSNKFNSVINEEDPWIAEFDGKTHSRMLG